MSDNNNTTGTELTTKHEQLFVPEIQSLIKTIRGQQVILDSDLAMLYQVETKRLNEQVKRNIERFPEDFMFQLTSEECSRSQIATLNGKRGQNIKYLPYAFTEQGISMLSGVLRSSIAIEVNIRIMRAFVAMRHFLSDNAQLFNRLESIEHDQLLLHSEQIAMKQHQEATDKRIDEVFKAMEQSNATPTQGIFFNGQIYDAYKFVAERIRSAKHCIILIDNYVDETVLTLLDKRAEGVTAKIYTASINRQLSLDLDRHNSQYAPIEIAVYRRAHDRFLIIDQVVYHIGASIKDLGKKLFAFSLMNDWSAEDLLAKMEER